MTKIIAFEGIDGTGKTVQMQALAERLEKLGLAVMQLSFPMYESFFGAEVGRLLSGRDGVRADEVDQKSMALWFALDRYDCFRTLDYSSADVLLINRYVLSNAVYQSIRDRDLAKPDMLDFIFELEHGHFGIPRADRYVVFDMEPLNASENVSKKGFRDYVGASAKDVYEEAGSIQARARLKYREYAEKLDYITILDCMGDRGLKSIAEISDMVDAALESLFGRMD